MISKIWSVSYLLFYSRCHVAHGVGATVFNTIMGKIDRTAFEEVPL